MLSLKQKTKKTQPEKGQEVDGGRVREENIEARWMRMDVESGIVVV